MELTCFAQLHDRDGGEQLAVRGHAELRRRRHGHLRGDISEAEALGPDELLIAHDSDDDAGERSIRNLSFHPRGKEPLCAKHFGVVGDSHVGGGRLFHCGWIRAGLWVR